jgi:hypothetical protein
MPALSGAAKVGIVPDDRSVRPVRIAGATTGRRPGMEKQTVEVAFQGEVFGSCFWDAVEATYTLYRLPEDVYLVYIIKEGESWLVANGDRGFGLTAEEVRMTFPHLADATGMGPPEILVLAP